MSNSARADIFAQLRQTSAATRAQDPEAELAKLGRAPAATLPAQNLCMAFLINVLRNRGSIDRAGNRSETVKAVGSYLYKHFRSQRLVAGNDQRLAAMPWRDAGLLPRFGGAEANEPVALSYAQLGIAETGATVTFTGKANPGSNNLLPEHHIVLVDAADLVATLEQAWDKINEDIHEHHRPRGINFIAGPSSTADIEGELVQGAHGPRNWHVILVGTTTPEDVADRARAALAAL